MTVDTRQYAMIGLVMTALKITQDPDRVRSFGGPNTRQVATFTQSRFARVPSAVRYDGRKIRAAFVVALTVSDCEKNNEEQKG